MSSNEKQYYIYYRSTHMHISCTKSEFRDFYRGIDSERQRLKDAGTCRCPKNKQLKCDLDCQTCDYYQRDTLSLDYSLKDAEGNERSWLDDIPDPFAVVGANIEERELVTALQNSLSTLSAFEQEICRTIMDGLSERAAAAHMNLPRNTYVYHRNKVLSYLKNSLKNFI